MSEMAIDYKRRDISVDDYHRMADAGIFGPEERVELIDGELIELPPIGTRIGSDTRSSIIISLKGSAVGLSSHRRVRFRSIAGLSHSPTSRYSRRGTITSAAPIHPGRYSPSLRSRSLRGRAVFDRIRSRS